MCHQFFASYVFIMQWQTQRSYELDGVSQWAKTAAEYTDLQGQ